MINLTSTNTELGWGLVKKAEKMTTPNNSADDNALLARLNALKKSTIDLETKQPAFAPTKPDLPVDPAPARALHTDLMSRFKSLNGQQTSSSGPIGSNQNSDVELLADEDGKTVEDLLAELGPEDSWNIEKDEELQIQDLLRTANKDLESSKKATFDRDEELKGESQGVEGGEDKRPSKPDELSDAEVEREADEYLAQVMEELKHAPQSADSEEEDETHAAPRADHQSPPEAHPSSSARFPSAPVKELDLPPSYSETTADDDLASRFASLGLPSVPTTIKSTTKQAPTQNKQPIQQGFTDEEIDSWCIICDGDATLRCIGCDGDLYCTECWLDGHKGEDAGYEERTHKAVQYNKGGGLKKQPARRRVIGA